MTTGHLPTSRMISPRMTNGGIVLACLGLMMAALFLQEVDGLHPCPLCISQRICVIAVGVLALLAFIQNPARTGLRIYASLQGLAALMGAGVAARHLWIQSLPAEQVPACGPGLQYMFANFPFLEALNLLLAGDGSCAEVELFLGLPIPAWVLIACLCLLAVNIWQICRR